MKALISSQILYGICAILQKRISYMQSYLIISLIALQFIRQYLHLCCFITTTYKDLSKP